MYVKIKMTTFKAVFSSLLPCFPMSLVWTYVNLPGSVLVDNKL